MRSLRLKKPKQNKKNKTQLPDGVGYNLYRAKSLGPGVRELESSGWCWQLIGQARSG